MAYQVIPPAGFYLDETTLKPIPQTQAPSTMSSTNHFSENASSTGPAQNSASRGSKKGGRRQNYHNPNKRNDGGSIHPGDMSQAQGRGGNHQGSDRATVKDKGWNPPKGPAKMTASQSRSAAFAAPGVAAGTNVAERNRLISQDIRLIPGNASNDISRNNTPMQASRVENGNIGYNAVSSSDLANILSRIERLEAEKHSNAKKILVLEAERIAMAMKILDLEEGQTSMSRKIKELETTLGAVSASSVNVVSRTSGNAGPQRQSPQSHVGTFSRQHATGANQSGRQSPYNHKNPETRNEGSDVAEDFGNKHGKHGKIGKSGTVAKPLPDNERVSVNQTSVVSTPAPAQPQSTLDPAAAVDTPIDTESAAKEKTAIPSNASYTTDTLSTSETASETPEFTTEADFRAAEAKYQEDEKHWLLHGGKRPEGVFIDGYDAIELRKQTGKSGLETSVWADGGSSYEAEKKRTQSKQVDPLAAEKVDWADNEDEPVSTKTESSKAQDKGAKFRGRGRGRGRY